MVERLSWVILPVAVILAVGILALWFQFQIVQTQQIMVAKLTNVEQGVNQQNNQIGNLTANLQIQTLNKLDDLEDELKNRNDTDTAVPASIKYVSLSQHEFGGMNIIPDENITSSIPNGTESSGSISGFGGGVVVIQP